MNLSIVARSDGSKLTYNKKAMQLILSSIGPGEVQIVFERYTGTRTLAQLGYYFAAVVAGAAKYLGWEPEDMHDYLKENCNKKERVLPTGEIVYFAGSTKDMKKMEYSEFIDRCIRHLAEVVGYVVETPEEYYDRMEAELNHAQRNSQSEE